VTVSAGPITTPIHYQTWGSVSGVTDGPIGFSGAFTSIINTPGVIPLGQFTVPTLPVGGTLTYTDVPFDLTMQISTPNVWWTGPPDELLIHGVLNGTLDGLGNSTMTATIVNTTPYVISGTSPIPLDSIHVIGPQSLIGWPNSIFAGSQANELYAYVSSGIAPVPEPGVTTSALLVLAGLALPAKRMLTRRRNAVARQAGASNHPL
jgi:hypothetical protein